MTSITALPAISALPATTTVSRAKALVASNAVAVLPVRSIPDEQRRQTLRQTNQGNATEDGDLTLRVSERVREQAALRSPAQPQTGSTATGSSGGGTTAGDQAATGATTPGIGTQSGPNAGFIAQSLYQENLGSGLYIEPWSDALGAYRRADSLNAPASSRSINV